MNLIVAGILFLTMISAASAKTLFLDKDVDVRYWAKPPATCSASASGIIPTAKISQNAKGVFEFVLTIENTSADREVCLSRFYEPGLPVIHLEMTDDAGNPVFQPLEVAMKEGDRMYETFPLPKASTMNIPYSFQPGDTIKKAAHYKVHWAIDLNGHPLKGELPWP